ncbi:MAG TPA: sensor histidine kinase [Dehalococcoidia bacterium]|nr:sensor histidine kinase [Dehalococcoidia bacterium]
MRTLAAVLAILSGVSAAASAALGLVPDGPGDAGTLGAPVVDAAVSLSLFGFAAVGALIARRRALNPVGWLLIATGLTVQVEILAMLYADYALTEARHLPGGVLAQWLTTWLWWTAVTLGGVFLLLLFPEGRLRREDRLIARVAAANLVLGSLAPMLAPGPLFGSPVPVNNPVGIAGLGRVTDAAGALALFALLGCIIAALASLLQRLRSSAGDERQQFKWLGSAVALTALTLPFPGFLFPRSEVAALAGTLAFASIPVATGVAIFRYHLYDIDLILNRTLVYGTLTTGLVAAYALAVASLTGIFRTEQNFAISVAGAGVVAVLFHPARDLLQRLANRLVYGQRGDPFGLVSALGQRLETVEATEDVLETIVESVASGLKLSYTEIALDGPHAAAARHPAGSTGPPGDRDVLELPLVYQREAVGMMRLAARGPGESFPSSERRLLEGLSRTVGAAAHSVRLSQDLTLSRERLVSAREEERRRLRRDLHDGLGPRLASLMLKLEAATNLLTRDPAAVARLLGELKGQTQEALADVRRAVYDLRPPALDELGLLSALREHASRSVGAGEGGPAVRFLTPDCLPALPAAVEVAAYRIVVEAITNVMRHAGAQSCTVRVAIDDGLILEVEDDGAGIAAEVAGGVGLKSMRERASELGGTLRVGRGRDGGTLVAAWLPLPAASS